MKYILVFLTLIWTLTKAEFDEICNHPTVSLESLVDQCTDFEPSRKPPRRPFIRRRPPRPKLGHRSLNSKKPEVVHLVSLKRRFLSFHCNPLVFQKLRTLRSLIQREALIKGYNGIFVQI